MSKTSDEHRSHKRRKVDTSPSNATSTKPLPALPLASSSKSSLNPWDPKDIILGLNQDQLKPSQKEPGKFLAIDCEMVGVGPNGSESSLARVSIVNFFGHTVMDVYVRQREKVTDWRTFVSGIRPADMINAKPFKEVQQEIADLIKDRVLIGHAIENDLRALLLSQPKHLVRDTQRLAGHSKLLGGSKRPSLRKLIEKEFGVVIQQGEHNSVTDARATMALYRKHRSEWDKLPGFHMSTRVAKSLKDSTGKKASKVIEEETLEIKPVHKKRKRIEDLEQHAGEGVKGFSSGLTTVVRHKTKAGEDATGAAGWWSNFDDLQPLADPSAVIGRGKGGSKGGVSLKWN